MCDQELVAAILEELGYLDEKKEKDKKEGVHEEENIKEDTRNAGEREQKQSKRGASLFLVKMESAEVLFCILNPASYRHLLNVETKPHAFLKSNLADFNKQLINCSKKLRMYCDYLSVGCVEISGSIVLNCGSCIVNPQSCIVSPFVNCEDTTLGFTICKL